MTSESITQSNVTFPLLINKLKEIKGGTFTLHYDEESKLKLYQDGSQVMLFEMARVGGVQEFCNFIEEILAQ